MNTTKLLHYMVAFLCIANAVRAGYMLFFVNDHILGNLYFLESIVFWLVLIYYKAERDV